MTTMNLYASPLQIQHHFFSTVNIQANVDGKPNGVISVNTSFGANALDETRLKWEVRLEVELAAMSEVKPFYTGKIECIGHFTVSPEFPKEKTEQLVIINGSGMLYAAIREFVLIITSRGPFPPVNLISQSFAHGFAVYKQLNQEDSGPKPAPTPT